MIKFARTGLRSLSLLLGVAFFLSGCAGGTKVTKTWTAPGFTGTQFKKVFVLVMAKDDFNRRLAENAVIGQMSNVTAVASYELLPDISDLKIKDKVIKTIKESGADGLIVLRILYNDSNVTYGPTTALPMEYSTFSGYYGTTYDVSAFYSQDRRSLNMERVFGVETSIFDVQTEKPIWMAKTDSKRDNTNDHDVIGLATDVAKTVKSALRAQDLIK